MEKGRIEKGNNINRWRIEVMKIKEFFVDLYDRIWNPMKTCNECGETYPKHLKKCPFCECEKRSRENEKRNLYKEEIRKRIEGR